MLLNIKRTISKVLSNIHFETEEAQEDVYKDQKLERSSFDKTYDLEKAEMVAKQFPDEIKKQKPKDKKCLLNFYVKHKIPRNTRCDSTGLKYKNCCGKIS